MTAESQLAAARLRLNARWPYLSTALWSLQCIAHPGVPTAAVDRFWRLYYNPDTVIRWELAETVGVLYHELTHLLRDHAGRGDVTSDRFLWNLAADAEINDDLRDEAVSLPTGALYPESLGLPAGLLAEEYYRRLHRWNSREGAEVTRGRCGSAGGRAECWELGRPRPGAPGLVPGEAALIRREVAVAVRQHARARGAVPATWARWAEDWAEPQVDWRAVLAGHARAALASLAGAADYTYRRPSRRPPVSQGILLPALCCPAPDVAVVVDTSSSQDAAGLAMALAEVDGILRAVGVRQGVTVLSVDSAVHCCERVYAPAAIRLIGRGGTDMGVGLSAAAALRPRPTLVVVITDGWTPWPESPPPGLPVVVLLTDREATGPDWAACIKLPD